MTEYWCNGNSALTDYDRLSFNNNTPKHNGSIELNTNTRIDI